MSTFRILLPSVALLAPLTAHADAFAFVGTYTSGKSEGIYAYRLGAEEAGVPTLVAAGLAARTPQPSFLVVDPTRNLLLAVNETADHGGAKTGAVSSFRVDAQSGALTPINTQPSMGQHPCHLALDPSGHFVLVANYTSGTVAVLPVGSDGTLGPATDVVQFSGHGPNPQRQEGPHAHCVVFAPTGNFVFVCDLGLDRVSGFRLRAESGKLESVPDAGAVLKPGAGPRHLVFHPNGRTVYVLNELDSTVAVFAYAPDTGVFSAQQTLSTLPADFQGASTCAEIAVDPSGRWLYASNRGHDSLARFAIGADRGELTFLGTTPAGGKTPRHFALFPSGHAVVAASQESDGLSLFRLHAGDGGLEAVGAPVPTPTPVCVAFYPDVGGAAHSAE